MHSITAALENLLGPLTDDIPHAPGIRIFDSTFPLNDAFDPLAWLCSQTICPQFYWQHRGGAGEVSALGAVRHFSSVPEATLFYGSTHNRNCESGA